MTDKQRFLVYVRIGNLLAAVRRNSGLGICEAVRFMLSRGIIQKLEDIDTGYYLESSGYLKRELINEHI